MADKITRGDIVAAVRILLDDDQFDSSVITQAADWFQKEVTNRHRLRKMEESDTIALAVGDTTADLPDDYQTIINIYSVTPQVVNLMGHYVQYEDFMKSYPNWAVSNSAQVGTWTDFGDGMRFAAPISVAATLSVDYLRLPTTITNNDSDEFEFNDNWMELFSKGTLARVMEINEDYDEASNERSNYAPLILDFIKMEGRGQIKTGPVVMRTNRRPGAYRADKDF